MANNVHNSFSFNFKHILIDEIALNGLEGIGLASLWNHVEKRISSPVSVKMKARFWKTLVNCQSISFYRNPEPVECVEVLDRFMIIHEETGHLLEPDITLDGEYEYHPVDGQYGSCVHFHTRKPELRENLEQIPYETIMGSEYMDRLVMVASLEERWRALADHKPISYLAMLNPVHYCILELVGKGRENGQMTQGKTNLIKIVKDSKFLFYNRNFLQKLDLIRAQHTSQKKDNKLTKVILLRLKRYHLPPFLCTPKVGKLRSLIHYLMEQPDNSEKTQVMIEKGLLTVQECKRLQKTVNVFDFEERTEPTKNSNSEPLKGKAPKKKYMTLTCPSESESGDSDNDSEELQCQYKVGVSLMRQAYEALVEAGLKGLTQIELGQLLGVEFYASRNICKVLKANNIVREFLEDKGKQRTARYITVNATREMDVKYDNEKQKLLNYVSETRSLGDAKSTATSSKRSGDDLDPEILEKKPRIGEERPSCIVPDINVIEREVTEVKVLEGMENFKANSLLKSQKNLTLRQLRFANGVLKVLRERLAVSGYCTLSTLVAKEINEPPLDSKRLKMFLQKLITDGQVKILKMKWPGPSQNYSHLLCAPQVKPTDQVIVTKYRELCLRALKFRKHKHKKVRVKNETGAPEPDFNPVFLHKYPKYMKIQKLHELLTKVVYFEREDSDLSKSDTPEGFGSLVYLIPEMTVDFAMSNMKQTELAEVLHGKNNIDQEYYSMKLKETPPEVNNLFLKTSGLQINIKYNLRILAILGLIQLIREPNQVGDNVILSYSFYVNRNASILDTTGKWPRAGNENQVERKYYFATFEDVERYWHDVYSISTKTEMLLESKDRKRKTYSPVLRLIHEVHANDNGKRYGDGLGPCGTDASFFMDIPRSWSTFYCNLKKKHQLQLKQPIKLPKNEKKPKVKAVKVPIRRRPRVRKTIPAPKAKPAVPKPKALRTVTSGIKWSVIEDQVLMLSKAAITVMSPVSQPGSLRVRNIVAKDVLLLNDPKKLASVCHLRAQTLESNTTLTYQKECLINELRHRGNLMTKYDGLMKKIRVRHAGNLSKYMQEARLPMLELMWVFYQISKSDSFNRKTPCVALSYEKFHDSFTICPASSNKGMNLYHTPLEVEPKIAALKEGMVMCVMLSFQNEQPPEVAQKVFDMFDPYPETVLRMVIEQVRKCGAVAAREKLFNNMISKEFFQEIVQSSYKLSAYYQRRWICRLNSEFVEKLNACLYQETDSPKLGVKGSPEVNCFLNELHASNALDIFSVSVPVITGSSGSVIQDEQMTVGDTLMKFNLKTGTFGWWPTFKAKKFAQIFDEIEFKDSLKELASYSTVQVVHQKMTIKESTENVQEKNVIISHLEEKKEAGSTFPELEKATGYDSKTLFQQLQALEYKKVIKRVGYYQNFVILTEFAKPWTLSLGENEIIPTPWLTLEQDKIRPDIFLKWAGVIVNTVFMYPGCSIAYLSEQCEFLTTRSAQDLCVTLEKFGCLKLHVLKDAEPNWWSEDDMCPQLEEFNRYDIVGNIVIFPVKDSFIRYAYVKTKILEEYGKQ